MADELHVSTACEHNSGLAPAVPAISDDRFVVRMIVFCERGFSVILVQSFTPFGQFFLYQICSTLLSASNFQFKNDRVGLTRSAVFLMFFMVIHGVGTLHVFAGPDDFNGYGYFYARMYWTCGSIGVMVQPRRSGYWCDQEEKGGASRRETMAISWQLDDNAASATGVAQDEEKNATVGT